MIKLNPVIEKWRSEVAWNLVAPTYIAGGFTKHSCSNKFQKNHRQIPVQESLFKAFCNFIRKEALAQVFSFEFWKIFRDPSFAERLQITASARWEDTQEVHKTGESFNCYTKRTTGLLVKTAAKKFILIKFQTCISNWPL